MVLNGGKEVEGWVGNGDWALNLETESDSALTWRNTVLYNKQFPCAFDPV